MEDIVYVPEDVQQVEQLHSNIYQDGSWVNQSLKQTLELHSQNLFQAYRDKNEASQIEISNHHPNLPGASWEVILNANLEKADIDLVTAKAHGFDSWAAVEELEAANPDADFETAVDLIVTGKVEELMRLLGQNTELVKMRSCYGHQATLFHYLGSNAVEIRRQKVPKNILEIAQLLIDSGADPNASCRAYDEQYTTLQLAETSAHPIKAGIADELNRYLKSVSG